MGMMSPEESTPHNTKNWLCEKKHFEILVSGLFMEWKRAQEMRVGEFSMQKLRESHDMVQELTSQIQELQERVNYMSGSRDFQDIESTCSGKLSHVPGQPAVVPSPRSLSSCDRSMPLQTWNALGHRETFLAIHVTCSIHHRCLIKEFVTQRIKVPQVESQCREVQGDLSREVKNELEAQFQCLCLQGGCQP